MMKEKLKHKEAFEIYYKMGDTRTLPGLAHEINVSPGTTKSWSCAFDWQERILTRDTENAKRLAKRNDKDIIKIKARMLEEIETETKLTRAVYATGAKKIGTGELEVKSARDLYYVASALEKLRKLELLLRDVEEPGAGVSVNINLKNTNDSQLNEVYGCATRIWGITNKAGDTEGAAN